MTLNGAIMQLVEMRENSLMPVIFKPYFDKVIETISECEEPSVQPEWNDLLVICANCGHTIHVAKDAQHIIRCKDCKHWKHDHTCREHSLVSPMSANEFCSRAERRTDG